MDDTAEEVTRRGGCGVAVACDHTDDRQVRRLLGAGLGLCLVYPAVKDSTAIIVGWDAAHFGATPRPSPVQLPLLRWRRSLSGCKRSRGGWTCWSTPLGGATRCGQAPASPCCHPRTMLAGCSARCMPRQDVPRMRLPRSCSVHIGSGAARHNEASSASALQVPAGHTFLFSLHRAASCQVPGMLSNWAAPCWEAAAAVYWERMFGAGVRPALIGEPVRRPLRRGPGQDSCGCGEAGVGSRRCKPRVQAGEQAPWLLLPRSLHARCARHDEAARRPHRQRVIRARR